MKASRWAILAAGVAAFGAAPAAGEDGADPRVGDQVDRICFGRNINTFRTIEGEDDAILLERGVNDWFKATLIGACNYSQLRGAQSVAIEQRPAGGCLTTGDYLIFSNSAFGEFRFPDTTRCVISRIHKWNDDAGADEAANADAD